MLYNSVINRLTFAILATKIHGDLDILIVVLILICLCLAHPERGSKIGFATELVDQIRYL